MNSEEIFTHLLKVAPGFNETTYVYFAHATQTLSVPIGAEARLQRGIETVEKAPERKNAHGNSLEPIYVQKGRRIIISALTDARAENILLSPELLQQAVAALTRR